MMSDLFSDNDDGRSSSFPCANGHILPFSCERAEVLFPLRAQEFGVKARRARARKICRDPFCSCLEVCPARDVRDCTWERSRPGLSKQMALPLPELFPSGQRLPFAMIHHTGRADSRLWALPKNSMRQRNQCHVASRVVLQTKQAANVCTGHWVHHTIAGIRDSGPSTSSWKGLKQGLLCCQVTTSEVGPGRVMMLWPSCNACMDVPLLRSKRRTIPPKDEERCLIRALDRAFQTLKHDSAVPEAADRR